MNEFFATLFLLLAFGSTKTAWSSTLTRYRSLEWALLEKRCLQKVVMSHSNQRNHLSFYSQLRAIATVTSQQELTEFIKKTKSNGVGCVVVKVQSREGNTKDWYHWSGVGKNGVVGLHLAPGEVLVFYKEGDCRD